MGNIGIYAFYHGKVCLYVGQSVELKKRIGNHLGSLKRRSHKNRNFQKAFDAAKDNVTVVILEECGQERLNERELYYWTQLKPTCCLIKPTLRLRYTGNPGEKRLHKLCAICDKPFKAQQSRAKFCSKECYYEGRKKTHTCSVCKEIYTSFATNSTFCSPGCFYKNSSVTSTCTVCKREVTASRAVLYCEGCKRVNTNTCITCKKTFTSARAKASYCSHACRHTEAKYSKECRTCGKAFHARHNNARSCSKECREAWPHTKALRSEMQPLTA